MPFLKVNIEGVTYLSGFMVFLIVCLTLFNIELALFNVEPTFFNSNKPSLFDTEPFPTYIFNNEPLLFNVKPSLIDTVYNPTYIFKNEPLLFNIKSIFFTLIPHYLTLNPYSM